MIYTRNIDQLQTLNGELRTRMASLLGLPYQNKGTWLAMAETLMRLGDICHQLQQDELADKYRHKAELIRGRIK